MIGDFFISLKIAKIYLGVAWIIIGVYGRSNPQIRHNFWEELYEVRRRWDGPWLIGGDFNVIRFMHEKNNPNRVTRSMRDFGTFITIVFYVIARFKM